MRLKLRTKARIITAVTYVLYVGALLLFARLFYLYDGKDSLINFLAMLVVSRVTMDLKNLYHFFAYQLARRVSQ